jgi:predicted nucleic acid-binding protein
MLKDYEIVIADTSCFILLSKKAKQNGVIPFLAPVLEKVQHTNFRFFSEVLTQILLMAEE